MIEDSHLFPSMMVLLSLCYVGRLAFAFSPILIVVFNILTILPNKNISLLNFE